MRRGFRTALALLLVVVFAVSAAGLLYWWRLKASPEYSLALLVERVHTGDDSAVDEFVDMDAVIEDFLPQVEEKAMELYAKGLPPGALGKIAELAAPLKPVVKARAREEFPDVIRSKTARYQGYPAWLMAIGLGSLSTVVFEGDGAVMTLTLRDRRVDLSLRRSGSVWKIVGVKDETLARQVAEKIGRDLILAAIEGGAREVAERLGIGGVNEILDQVDDIVR